MRTFKSVRHIFILLGLSLLLVACGKDDDNGGGGSGTVNMNCPAGQVWSQYRNTCLPQYNCPMDNAWYGNQCEATGTAGMGNCQGHCQAGYVAIQGQCYPQNTSCGACGAMIQGYGQCVYGTSQYGYGGQYGGYPYYGGGYQGGYYPSNNNYQYRQWGPFYYYRY